MAGLAHGSSLAAPANVNALGGVRSIRACATDPPTRVPASTGLIRCDLQFASDSSESAEPCRSSRSSETRSRAPPRRVGPVGRRPRPRLGAGVRRRHRRRHRPDQRARAARRGGRGDVRRRAHRARAGRRRGRGPRPRGDRGRHRRRAGGRVGSRAAGCGRDRRAGVRARQPRRPRPARDVRAWSARPGARSAGRAAAASAARWSTPRRCRAAPRAARSSTREHRLLGLNSIRLEGGLILALPADAAMQRRAEALAAGTAPERPRLGIAHRARARRAADARRGRPAGARRPARARGRRRTARRRGPGCERGDLLVGVNGNPLSSVDELFDALEAGGELTLDVLRGTEERDGRRLTSVVEVLS